MMEIALLGPVRPPVDDDRRIYLADTNKAVCRFVHRHADLADEALVKTDLGLAAKIVIHAREDDDHLVAGIHRLADQPGIVAGLARLNVAADHAATVKTARTYRIAV